MKKIAIVSVIFLGVFAVYFGVKVSADEKEKDLVKIPLENYLKGHETGKAEYMQKAFHTEGKLMFIRDGKYTTRDFKDYIGGMKGETAKDEAERKRKIESIDIAGNAAVARIVLDYPTVKFTDYMSLLKIDGEWKIVNKTFYAERKEKNDK